MCQRPPPFFKGISRPCHVYHMPEVLDMQPVAVITSPAEGLVYINGRLAGETGPEAALMLPVTPNGIVYLELRPFARRFRSCAHRFRFASGELDPASVSDACHVVLWPGGICEIALSPLPAYPPESDYAVMDGLSIAVLRGERAMLRVGKGSVALPEGAGLPESHVSAENAEIFLGKAPGEQYIAVFTRELTALNALAATEIHRESDTEYLAVTALEDAAGHMRRERIAITPLGAEAVSASISPSRQPETPEHTALAAVEALMLDETGEADAYLSPEARRRLEHILEDYDAALPVKYAPPQPQPAVALIRRIADRVARGDMLYYHARPEGQRWRIDDVEKGRRN